MLQNIVLLGTLTISAYHDLKEKSVYLYVLLTAAIAGLVLHIIYQNRTIIDILGGSAIGVFVVLLAWMSKESIGVGDGLTLMVCGIFLGFEKNLSLFILAICLSAVAALFLFVVKRKESGYRMPFLPFLLAAYLLLLL